MLDKSFQDDDDDEDDVGVGLRVFDHDLATKVMGSFPMVWLPSASSQSWQFELQLAVEFHRKLGKEKPME